MTWFRVVRHLVDRVILVEFTPIYSHAASCAKVESLDEEGIVSIIRIDMEE